MRYYTLDQAIQLFNDTKISRFFDLPQLADLCGRGLLTPTVFYSKCLGHIDREAHYHQQHQTIKGACTFKGYLTHDALGDLLTDYANTPNPASDAPIARFSSATIYETCRAYYAWGDNANSPPPYKHGDMVALLGIEPSHDEPHPPTTHDRADSDIFTVTPNMLRLPADELHSCIDDMKAEHANDKDELSPRSKKGYDTTIGVLLELLLKPQRGRDKELFASQDELAKYIEEMKLQTQSEKTVTPRFTSANAALKEIKELPRRHHE